MEKTFTTKEIIFLLNKAGMTNLQISEETRTSVFTIKKVLEEDEVMKDLYFLEYSLSQKCYHIDKAKDLVNKNRGMIGRGHQPEYAPIFLGSLEDCNKLADQLELELKYLGEAINEQ